MLAVKKKNSKEKNTLNFFLVFHTASNIQSIKVSIYG